MPTELTLHSPHQGAHPGTRQCLVYYLTGNPGLINYYTLFLTHLRSLLDTIETQRGHKVTFTIYGRDLAGFDAHDHPKPFNRTDHPPHDVEYEINHCYKHLLAANKLPASTAAGKPHPRAGEPFDEVVLVGHSLGTYIALELFHRHLQDPSAAPALRLRAGVLLFATIAHLARAPNAVWFNFLRARPFLARHVPFLASRLVALLPGPVVRWFAAAVLGMPPHAAAVTAQFLTTRDAVYQALYLGLDEMAVISDDGRWAEALWEVEDEAEAAAGAHEVPKFFLFYGKNDRWVANEYRERFIAARKEHAEREGVPVHKRGRTRIVVDEGDLPHDFCISEFLCFSSPRLVILKQHKGDSFCFVCIRCDEMSFVVRKKTPPSLTLPTSIIEHSEIVAEKVGLWLDEIAEHP